VTTTSNVIAMGNEEETFKALILEKLTELQREIKMLQKPQGCLRRPAAAAYMGVSLRTFDTIVVRHSIPKGPGPGYSVARLDRIIAEGGITKQKRRKK
jgi:hypothetical protein